MGARRNGKVLFLEPSSGISGDMFLGSLLDLGLNANWLSGVIESVLPGEAEVRIWREKRAGIGGTRFGIEHEGKPEPRGLSAVREIIDDSELPSDVKTVSREMFQRLAEVEAGIHGTSPDEIHFHEVGALDSIADIVGGAAAIWKLEPTEVRSGPVNLGGGTVETEHGELPVPAPATAELLRGSGAPTYSDGIEAELTTPTGALILAEFVDEFTRPRMELEEIGYGLGARSFDERANLLRSYLASRGGSLGEAERDHSVVMKTNLDDMNPELFPVLEEKLLEAGALDVYRTPVQMKKGRPGIEVTVVCNPGSEKRLSEVLFRESSTLGVRSYGVERRKLERDTVTLETDVGSVEVKVGYLDGEPVNYAPEFESCRRLAERTGLTTKEVYQKALAAAEAEKGKN